MLEDIIMMDITVSQPGVRQGVLISAVILLVTLLGIMLACGSRASVNHAPVTRAAALASPACFDPTVYGAIPDDGLSDRVAFQAALDAAGAAPDGGTVCVGRGRWTIDRASIGSYNHLAGISTHAHGVTIAGAGQETVLELVGDQGLGDIALISIDPSAQRILLRDFSIDSTAAFNTSEQTHAIATSAVCNVTTCLPISDVTISNVTIRWPKIAAERKGDCIRLLGNSDATRVDRVHIEGVTLSGCARAGIEIQRNVHGLIVSGSSFAGAMDTDIDSEPTGGAGDVNDTIIISGNTFVDDPTAQGDYAVTLGGIGAPMSGVVFTGNVLNRGLAMYRTGTAVIADNVIAATMKGTAGSGVVEVSNVCAGLVMHHNAITRSGTAGAMMRLTPHSGGICGDVTIDHNRLVQNTPGFGVYGETVSGSIASNVMAWTVSAPNFAAIYDRATVAIVTHLQIKDNRITGPVTYGVLLSSAPFAFGVGVSVVANYGDGPTYGMYCTGTGGFSTITSYGNDMGPRICTGVTFNSGVW